MLYAVLPQRQSNALLASLGHHKVEAEKSKVARVVHDANCADGLIVIDGNEDAVGIHLIELLYIAQPGIPALGCRPRKHLANLAKCGLANLDHRALSWRIATSHQAPW